MHLSGGISSYEDLARKCDVTRNTVYRRIASLENRGVIRNTLRCNVNMDQLDIIPICISIQVHEKEVNRALKLLGANKSVRLLWRTYGGHNIILVAFAAKGEEGDIIQKIRSTLEDFDEAEADVSVGFVWEKTDFSPFTDPLQTEEKVPLAKKELAVSLC